MGMLSRPKGLFFAISLLIGFPAILYIGSLSGGFVWDDDSFITHNEWIKDTGNAGIFFTPQYWAHHHPGAKGRYRPLRTLSFMANYYLGELNPYGYHLLNLIVHIFNALLVFLAARMIIGNHWGALGAGLLFAAHPVNTEAVAWIKNRAELFALFFVLLSYLLIIKSEYNGNRRLSRGLLYAVSLLTYLLALMSKETALTLPLLLVCHGALFPAPAVRKSLFLKTVPFWIITICFLAFVVRGSGGENSSLKDSPATVVIHLYIIGKTYCTYLTSLFFPINLHADRSLPFPPTAPVAALAVMGAFLVLIFVVMRRQMRSSPAGVFSVSWILITLIPSANLILISGRLVAEQRLYIPSVGLALLTGLLFPPLERKIPLKLLRQPIPLLKTAFFFLIALCFSLLTWHRIPVWHDGISLWEDSVKRNPTNDRSHYNLGLMYQDQGDLEAALREFSTVAQMNPASSEAHNSLGVVYASLNQLEKALFHYRRAIELNPNYARAHFNLGNTYLKLGRLDEAMLAYKEAIRLNPDYADAYANLGFAYQINGELAEAVRMLHQALRFDPNHTQANLNLGKTYYAMKSLPMAEMYIKKAQALDAHNEQTYFLLGNILKDRGDVSGAGKAYQEALRLNPRFAEAYNNLGTLLQQEGNMDLAIKNYREALSINPNYPEAHNNLANMYGLQKNFSQAIQEFQAALALRPDYFEAQFGLAGLYLIQGNRQQALEEYRKAHRLKPDVVEFQLGKALVMKSGYPLKEEIRRILALLKQETPRTNQEE